MVENKKVLKEKKNHSLSLPFLLSLLPIPLAFFTLILFLLLSLSL